MDLLQILSEVRSLPELRHPGHPDQKVHGRKGSGGIVREDPGPGGRLSEGSPAYDSWLTYAGCTRIRYAADEILGTPHAPAGMVEEQALEDSGLAHAIKVTAAGGRTDRPIADASVGQAKTLLDAVRGAPVTERPLYRGVQADRETGEGGALLHAGKGDEFDLGLVSTTPSPKIAASFASGEWMGQKRLHIEPVVIEVVGPKKAVASPESYDRSSGVPFEYVTTGRFVVTGARTVPLGSMYPEAGGTPMRVITVRQKATFNDDGIVVPLEQRSLDPFTPPAWNRLLDGPADPNGPRPEPRGLLELLGEVRHPGHPDQKVHGRKGSGGPAFSDRMPDVDLAAPLKKAFRGMVPVDDEVGYAAEEYIGDLAAGFRAVMDLDHGVIDKLQGVRMSTPDEEKRFPVGMGALAWTRAVPGGAEVVLSRGWFSQPGLRSVLADNGGLGNIAVGSIGGVIAHEMGHVRTGGGRRLNVDNRIVDRVREAVSPDFYTWESAGASLSRYATTNPSEFVAEAYSVAVDGTGRSAMVAALRDTFGMSELP